MYAERVFRMERGCSEVRMKKTEKARAGGGYLKGSEGEGGKESNGRRGKPEWDEVGPMTAAEWLPCLHTVLCPATYSHILYSLFILYQ